MTFGRATPRTLRYDETRWHPQFPQSWNRYAYVNNTPLAATDPTGLDGIKFGSKAIPLMADESWSGDCTLDGIATSCSWLMPKLSVGDALACGSLGCGGTVQTSGMTKPLTIEPTVRGWQYVNPDTDEVVTSASELGLPSPGSLGFDDSFQFLDGPQSGGGPESASAAGGGGRAGDTVKALSGPLRYPATPSVCSQYMRSGTGAGEILDQICMHFPVPQRWEPWAECVRAGLLFDYPAPGNEGTLSWWKYLFVDHPREFLGCAQ